jgi:hypothetical protein
MVVIIVLTLKKKFTAPMNKNMTPAMVALNNISTMSFTEYISEIFFAAIN